jgi:predicted nuclease of predicted toxin-antitoxin system
VKLLFDQHLAPGLVRRLADLYPGSAHVRDFGLQAADDEAIWARAGADGFAIVTKDDDFRQRSFLRGPPPKVVWVRLGNCRTADIEALLRARHADVLAFEADPEAALLVLSAPEGPGSPGRSLTMR